jgi:hypothetical protein
VKKNLILFCTCLIIGLMAGAALAITTVAVKPGEMPFSNGAPIQNIQATAPNKAGNVCVTKTIHNAGDIVTFNLYTSNRWYQKADWQAVKSTDGSAFIVQRKLGSNTAGTVGSSGSLTVNREYSSYKLATFGTATSATLTLCQDRQ